MPLFQVILAAFLGALLGLQRELERKAAGLRTYAFVAIGACVFTILSLHAFAGMAVDPSRIASQVVVGIGFLGAGVIFRRESHVEGITTAAGLWVTAAIGMAVGLGQYGLAIGTTVIALVLLFLGWFNLEERIANRFLHPPSRR